MQPAIVFPLHDPAGQWFDELATITPDLKALFAKAFVSVTPPTLVAQHDHLGQLGRDTFFVLNDNPPGSLIGDHFLAGYRSAVAACAPEQVLHLCFADRVMFALRGGYHECFVADIQAAQQGHIPTLFQRSEKAWATHPRNYCELEHMVTRVGELLWGKSLDWCWCHLAVAAGHLGDILAYVHGHDMSVLAEIVLLLKNRLTTQDVDWLAWENPYLLRRDAQQLRQERECSTGETRRRLAYVIPTLQVMYEATGK